MDNLTGMNTYKGMRYVPIFKGTWDGTNDDNWIDTIKYDPLIIVLYQGASYTSKTFVPIGVSITNTIYWAITGNYNAQVEQYRQEVQSFNGRITANETAISANQTDIAANEVAISDLQKKSNTIFNVKMYGAVGNGIADDTTAFENAITAANNKGIVYVPTGVYIITRTLHLTRNTRIIGENHVNSQLQIGADVDFFDTEENYYQSVELSNLNLRDPNSLQTPANGKCVVRFKNATLGITGGYFHDLRFYNTLCGFVAGSAGTGGVIGTRFKNITAETRVHSMYLNRTSACIVEDFVGDHTGIQNTDPYDFNFLAEGSAGGGLMLKRVVSQAPGKGGIQILNFSEVWGQNVSSDNAGATGVYLYNVSKVHMWGGYFALSSRLYPTQCNLKMSGCNDTHWTDCTFDANQSTGDSPSVLLDTSGANHTFTNCQMKESKGTGVRILSNNDVHIETCTIKQNQNHGIDMDTSIHSILLSNSVTNNTGTGVKDVNGNTNIVALNVITNNGTNANISSTGTINSLNVLS